MIMPMIVAKVLLKVLIVRVGAFKYLIATLSFSSAIEDITLITDPLSINTLFVR